MNVTRTLAVELLLCAASCASLTSCCSLPTWLGGNLSYEATVRIDVIEPTDFTTYTLCATGEEGTRGIVELKKGEVDAALVHLKAAVDANQSDPNALFNLGIAAEIDADYQTALDCFDKAIKLSSDDRYIASHKRVKNKRDY